MTEIQTITVYDGPNCMKCRVTKRKLQKLGAPYLSESARMPDGTVNPKIAHLGYTTLPIVTVTNRDGEITAHWSDLKPENIEAAAYLVDAA